MMQGAAGAKSTVGELIKKMQVVKIDRTGDMPNPYDNGAEAFASKFKKYDPECRDIQPDAVHSQTREEPKRLDSSTRASIANRTTIERRPV